MNRTILVFSAVLGCATVVACVDLFHDTDSLFADAGGVGGGDDANPDTGPVGPPLCTDSSADALTTATTACSWLGACALPFGVNEPGACMIEAVRAYDCGFDRDNAPTGARAAFWSCLQAASSARSCDAVTRCAMPFTRTCSAAGELFACLDESEPYVRIHCIPGVNAAAGAENCAAAGGRCVPVDGADSICSAAVPAFGGVETCTRSTCKGNTLSVCEESGSDGGVETAQIDCEQSGAGTCGAGSDAGPGCLATSSACGPDHAVECRGNVATRCRNALSETVNCANAGLGCDAEGAELTYQACRAVGHDDGGDAGVCVPRCDGTNVHACMNGLPVTFDCSEQGLGRCQTRTAQQHDVAGVACSAPGAATADAN